MNAVFLDTVGLIALMDIRDQWHRPANAAWAELIARPVDLITTPTVLCECGNALARSEKRFAVANLFQEMSDNGTLIEPTPAETRAAWIAYKNAPPGGPSIVDCLSFEVMRRVGATEAFTNDRHFTAAGFTVLF